MKKPILFSAFALLSCTLFSCTADDNETAVKTTEVKKQIIPETPTYADGPGDAPILVPPPPPVQ